MSHPKPLSEADIERIVEDYAELPHDYLDYLRAVGEGETASGHTIYSGPVEPGFVYGPNKINEDVVLLGDDSQGYCLAYHFSERRYGELSPRGQWEPRAPDRTFLSFLETTDAE